MSQVKVPADVELADTLAFGLTARQLLLLAATGITGYGSYLLLAPLLPAPVALAAAVVVVAVGLLLSLGRHQGLSGDQLALAAARHLHAPRLRLLAPDGLANASSGAPLELPVRRILRSGLVQLADGSHRLLAEAAGTSFQLRSPLEQQAFVDCFARLLNSLAEPLQLLVRSEPASLAPHADHLEQTAAELPAQLAQAALEHGRFLRQLAEETRLRRRRIVLVFTTGEREPELAQAALSRQAAEAAQLLAGAQIVVSPLDGEAAAALLAAALDPPGPPAGSHLEGVIHADPPPPPERS